MGCGRCISGFIVDSKIFKTINLYQSVLLLNGLTAVIGSFSSTPIHLIVYIWAFSFLDGQMQSTFAPVVREVVGMTYMTEGFAMVFTSCSVSMMLGPPLLGICKQQFFICAVIHRGCGYFLSNYVGILAKG